MIDSRHPTADVAITISFDEAPTSFADFSTTSSGAAIPILKGFGSITGDGIVRRLSGIEEEGEELTRDAVVLQR